VGAVDPTRAVAIAPVVLDALNFIQFSHHQFKSYNGWSFALSDYYEMNITSRFDDPNMQLLSEYEDPYYYLDRLTMPTVCELENANQFRTIICRQ
jgi:PhoPQ-activated pathogenicity-related protein